MITKVKIENYKSLENLSIELGRFNVLIGENGCGKTNILESLVFAAGSFNDKVENDFLVLRGGRASEPKFFKSGFENQLDAAVIKIRISDANVNKIELSFTNDNKSFSKWIYNNSLMEEMKDMSTFRDINSFYETYFDIVEETKNRKIKKEFEKESTSIITKLLSLIDQKAVDFKSLEEMWESFPLENYLIYAPENYFLRNTNIDAPYVSPVGCRGESILRLVKVIKKEKPDQYKEIIHHLHLIDWFENFEVNENIEADNEFVLSDKYLEDGLKSFDIRNANEGFLFVLFYLTIFISDYTPKFFAIDNIDTALNPKLCSKLISVLAELAKKHDKQVIITTHNPSVLDGLNLNDDEQRLFVIARNKSGRTKATRIEKKEAVNGTAPVSYQNSF